MDVFNQHYFLYKIGYFLKHQNFNAYHTVSFQIKKIFMIQNTGLR